MPGSIKDELLAQLNFNNELLKQEESSARFFSEFFARIPKQYIENYPDDYARIIKVPLIPIHRVMCSMKQFT